MTLHGALIAGGLWFCGDLFMLLAAAWNRENDEAAQRLFDRDNDNPEGEG